MNSQACGLLSITWWPLVKDISGTPYCPENSYSCHGQSRSTYNYKEKEKNYYTAWGFNIGRSSSGSLGLLTCALRISNRWEPATIQRILRMVINQKYQKEKFTGGSSRSSSSTLFTSIRTDLTRGPR
ncbi:hypothetical protein V6N13_135426 [Hibiscus sabdariffa]